MHIFQFRKFQKIYASVQHGVATDAIEQVLHTFNKPPLSVLLPPHGRDEPPRCRVTTADNGGRHATFRHRTPPNADIVGGFSAVCRQRTLGIATQRTGTAQKTPMVVLVSTMTAWTTPRNNFLEVLQRFSAFHGDSVNRRETPNTADNRHTVNTA